MNRKVKIGVIGCGNISGIYLKNLSETFQNTTLCGVADKNHAAASAAAKKFSVPAFTVEELLQGDAEIILNLTTPESHFDVCKQALLAGKHVYVEKPLSLSFAEGKRLCELASEEGLLIGAAPDTFLGGGIQTCRKLIDEGRIGRPIGATAFMVCPGHESWHPAPQFYYKKGAGPMFDMGPYYLTALLNLIGPVEKVMGMCGKAHEQRTITSQPCYGEVVDVEINTHINGLLRFKNGAIGNIITSFDVQNSTLPRIEIYGTEATLCVPDPNTFGGPVNISVSNKAFEPVPITLPYTENSRGLGVSDMARCLINGETNNRASGELALHVLEIMQAIDISNNRGELVTIASPFERTAPLT